MGVVSAVDFQHFISIDTEKYFTYHDPSLQISSSPPCTPVQMPEKSLSTGSNGVASISRAMSSHTDVAVQLPASSSASVFYTSLSPTQNPTTNPLQAVAVAPSGPGQVAAPTGGEDLPREISPEPEDTTDGHRPKKKHRNKGENTTKTTRRKEHKVKAIPEDQVAGRESNVLSFVSAEPEVVESKSAETKDNVFSISEIQTCMFGWWMCVANVGGSVMAFNFNLATPEEALKVCVCVWMCGVQCVCLCIFLL